jgi:membrane associated rhomboid family serine protease
VIPLKDDNPRKTFPVLTLALIGVNIAVFVYEWSLPTQAQHALFYSMAAIPAEFTRGSEVGAHTLHPVWLTLFTSMFLHGSWLHVLGNMLYLWIFGDNIEGLLGRVRFLIFYFACGVSAMMTHVAMNPASTVPALGASGAIAGVLGAYAVRYPRAKVVTLILFFPFIRVVPVPALILLGFWFLYQLFLGGASLVPGHQQAGVAWWAHVGGFVTGMVLISLLAPRRQRRTYGAWE